MMVIGSLTVVGKHFTAMGVCSGMKVFASVVDGFMESSSLFKETIG